MQKSKTFSEIYGFVSKISKGKVLTYRDVGDALGIRDFRIVGWALHGNKNEEIPCHRVVKKDGSIAKNYAFGGWKRQREKLVAEGITFGEKMKVDVKKHLFRSLK